MSQTIAGLSALEILDSRGRPTLEVTAVLSNGVTASAQVPSGASTGRHEALELRDGDRTRYGGRGVRRACAHVEGELLAAVRGMHADDQAALDRRMVDLDGTPDKSRLGANAMLGVSCAVARAAAAAAGEPLWRRLERLRLHAAPSSIPAPMINILSGGLHAGHNVEVQDFLVIVHGYASYAEALEAAVKIHGAAYDCLTEAGFRMTGVADEGGWGPLLESNGQALEILTQAIERAGFRPGEQAAIAVDVAATHFHERGTYHLRSEGRRLSPAEMIELLESWTARYPVWSLEDALAEDDWAGWAGATRRLGARAQMIGDDFFTTNPERVRRGLAERCGNAVLVKMNQIGTLTETFEVLRLAHEAGWRAVVSARSGETEDSFLADLAVASGAGQIKVGSITRGERLAKYNRLLALERAGGLEFAGSAPFRFAPR